MPKLIVPNETTASNTQPISVSGVADQIASSAKIGKIQQTAGAEAIASGAQLGQQEAALGSQIAQQGVEYFNKGIKAVSETIYNIAQSNAVKEYNKQASAHVSQALSRQSQPEGKYVQSARYSAPGTLAGELDGISKGVVKQYSEAVQDPVAKEKMSRSLGELNTNHKVMANAQERNMQIDNSTSALTDALDTDIQSGLIDSPDNIGFYASQGLDRIQAGVQAGTIDPIQAAKMGDKLRSGLFLGSLQVANQRDPNSVAQLLSSKTADELNLTSIEYDNLNKQNKFALQDQNTLNKLQYKAQAEVEQAQSQLAKSSLSDSITKGEAHTAQIVEAYDKGKITFKQYSELAEQYTKTNVKVDKTWQTRTNLSADMQAGSNLSSFSAGEIDDHYQNRLRSLSPDGSTNVPIGDRIALAAEYKGPVQSLARGLQADIEGGSIKKIEEAVFAYNKLQSVNPLVLSGIKDKKFTAYVSALSNSYKYTSEGLSTENIQRIKDSVYNVDVKTEKQRRNGFNEESDFSNDNIKATIANDIYPEGNPWYRGPDQVADQVVDMIKPLLRDAYMATGDVAAAKEMVANQTKTLVGYSEVNTVPRFGIDANTIMALPPEVVLSGRATAMEIRASINAEVADRLPDGVTPDQVLVGSDDLTVAKFKQKGNPSYYLYYMDADGHEVLLPDRWKYDNASEARTQNARVNAVNAKVNTENPQIVAKPEVAHTSEIAKAMTTTKGHGEHPAMNQELVDRVSKVSYVSKIADQYPGDSKSKPVVQAAIERMVGADKSSWRVGQSVKLINSVLTNNSNPQTYLQYGKATTQPTAGDIVVSANKAGIFAGMVNMGGKMGVQIVSMDGKDGLVPSVIPVSDVKGYRTLPSPENFASQSKPLSIQQTPQRFNIYTGEAARAGTGQESFNIYNMTNEPLKAADDKPKKTVINPVTGEMVDVNPSMKDQIKEATSATKQDTNPNIVVGNGQASTDSSQTSQVDDLTPDKIVTTLSSASKQIDVGNGQQVDAGDLLMRLNFGKATSSPAAGDVVVANGQVGRYVGEDSSNPNMIKIKVGDQTISIMKVDVKGYRQMPEGAKFKEFMKKFKALLEKRITLAELTKKEKGDNNANN